MDLNEVFNFLIEDIVYERILEHSMDSHMNDLFKKNDSFLINVGQVENNEEDTCQICLETIEKGVQIYNLDCQHKFHSSCLEQSISFQHYDCPACREKIPIRNKNEHVIVYNDS
jgi:hypothetical protein